MAGAWWATTSARVMDAIGSTRRTYRVKKMPAMIDRTAAACLLASAPPMTVASRPMSSVWRTYNDATAGPVVTINETRWLPRDPTMLGYISTSLLLFGCLYAAMVNTGLQVAAEWNDRTVKNLLLAPVGRGTLVAGKVLAGLGQSVVSVALVLAVLVVGFRFAPTGNLLAMAGIVVATLLMGAGIGAAFGVASKKTLAAASSLITLAMVLFLVSGNEESMRGLAWGQPITALWEFSRVLPTTYAFMSARSIFLTGDTSDLGRNLTIVLVATGAILGVAAWLLRRAYSHLTGGQ